MEVIIKHDVWVLQTEYTLDRKTKQKGNMYHSFKNYMLLFCMVVNLLTNIDSKFQLIYIFLFALFINTFDPSFCYICIHINITEGLKISI